MTRPDDSNMETQLRAMLSERSTDVHTSPALFQDVRARAQRGTRLRQAAGLVAVAAAVFGAFTLLPNMIAEPELPPIMQQPDAAPDQAEEGPAAADVPFPLALATTDALTWRGREQLLELAEIRSLAGPGTLTPVVELLGLVSEDDAGVRRVAMHDASPEQDGAGNTIVASPNGNRVAVAPGQHGLAWIEGRNLHVWPLGTDEQGVRVLPLDADAPDDLVIEQWFTYADAPVILASRPGTDGGVWSIPMDESDIFNTAPTDPAFLLSSAADADDAALLSDGTLLVLHAADLTGAAATISIGAGERVPLGGPLANATDIDMSVGASGAITFLDRGGDATAELMGIDASGDTPVIGQRWTVGSGLVGITTMGVEDELDGPGGSPPADESPTDGYSFTTDRPLLGTDGVSLVIHEQDGAGSRFALYDQAISEATLGRVAVRPGSSITDAAVAVESFSEGETSIRFAQLRDDAATPLGDVLVTDGPLTGLVWSPDGREIAWTTATSFATARVGADLTTVLEGSVASRGPVVDWIWTDAIDGRLEGVLITGTPDGAMMTEVQRFTNGELSVLDAIETMYFHDMHLLEVTSEGPSVGLRSVDGTLAFGWGGDGDAGGVLSLPDAISGSSGAGVHMKVSGGQVLLITDDGAWQVAVIDEGAITQLPAATDWDVLD